MSNTKEKYIKSLSILPYSLVKETGLEKDWLKLKAGVLFDEEVNETETVKVEEVKEEPEVKDPEHVVQQSNIQTGSIGLTTGKR